MGQIYKLSPTSSVGLVNATGGAHRPSADKPVMVSLVVGEKEVDAWWAYLKAKGVDVGDAPGAGGDAPGAEGDGAVKAFGFEDPEGYSLEVFAWVNKSRFATRAFVYLDREYHSLDPNQLPPA